MGHVNGLRTEWPLQKMFAAAGHNPLQLPSIRCMRLAKSQSRVRANPVKELKDLKNLEEVKD